MIKQKFIDLVNRAELYFNDELLYTKSQYKSVLFLFKHSEYTEQFVRENEKLKEFKNIEFTIQDDTRHLVISQKVNKSELCLKEQIKDELKREIIESLSISLDINEGYEDDRTTFSFDVSISLDGEVIVQDSNSISI